MGGDFFINNLDVKKMTIRDSVLEKLKKDVLKRVLKKQKDTETDIYFYREDLSKDQKLRAGPKALDLKHRTAFFFVDMAPQYNWGHPCQFLLYDVDREKQYKKVKAEFSPAF